MSDDDLTRQILTNIHDSLNARLDQTNHHLSEANQRLDGLRTELGGRIAQTNDRITEMDLRLATRMTEMTASNRSLHEMLSDRFELRDRIEQCERDIAELRQTR